MVYILAVLARAYAVGGVAFSVKKWQGRVLNRGGGCLPWVYMLKGRGERLAKFLKSRAGRVLERVRYLNRETASGADETFSTYSWLTMSLRIAERGTIKETEHVMQKIWKQNTTLTTFKLVSSAPMTFNNCYSWTSN